jgi:hypothetical protein
MAFIGGQTDGSDDVGMTAKNNELFAINGWPFSNSMSPDPEKMYAPSLDQHNEVMSTNGGKSMDQFILGL